MAGPTAVRAGCQLGLRRLAAQGQSLGGSRRLSSRTLVNGRFGYENPDWSAYVFASNLFDRGYTQYAWSDDSPNVILGAPRVVGIGFDYRW